MLLSDRETLILMLQIAPLSFEHSVTSDFLIPWLQTDDGFMTIQKSLCCEL